MAVIKIEAKKDTRCTQTICLIQGDRRTQILRFHVNRFDGGVDLSDLRWAIKTVNAAGVEDVFDPAAVEIGDARIIVDWMVDGSVTDADGMAKYELNGLDTVDADASPVIWRGGTGTISMRANIGPKFGESDGMTNIEKLILYVEGELQNIIDAGSAAQAAADRANHAADNIEGYTAAVDRANAAAEAAEGAAAAVGDLENAVKRANSAADRAAESVLELGKAATNADAAADRAHKAAEDVEYIAAATQGAYDAAAAATLAADAASTAAMPAATLYGVRVRGAMAKVSGNPVAFVPDAGSLFTPVTRFGPVQEGEGDASFDNYRPFSLRSSLSMRLKGYNLFDPSVVVNRTYLGIQTEVQGDGRIKFAGKLNSTTTVTRAIKSDANVFLTLPPGTYTLQPDNFSIRYMSNGVQRYDSGTFTLTKERSYVNAIWTLDPDAIYDEMVEIQLSEGMEALPYCPYALDFTHEFAKPMAGGTLNWRTGELKEGWNIVELVGGENEDWSYSSVDSSGRHRYNANITQSVRSAGTDCLFSDGVCNGVNSLDNKSDVWVSNSTAPNDRTLILRVMAPAEYSTLDKFLALLAERKAAGKPLQVAYPCVITQAEEQLAATAFTAYGANEEHSISGDETIEVQYVEPLVATIERYIAEYFAQPAPAAETPDVGIDE